MNKMPGRAAGVLLLLIFSLQQVTGQPRPKSYEGQNRFLTLNGTTISIDKLVFLDSVGPQGKVVSLAEFDFPLRNSDEMKSVIRELQSACQQNKTLSLTLSVANFNYEAVEERFYTDASVQLLYLSELDASEKISAKISVKIRAGSPKIVNDSKGKLQTKIPAASKSIMAANFQADFGTALPAKMIAKIGTIHLGCHPASDKAFTLEISAADMIPWRQWLFSDPSNPVHGTIQLLGPDLKEVLFELDLAGVEIISHSIKFGGTQLVTRAVVSLKAKQVMIK